MKKWMCYYDNYDLGTAMVALFTTTLEEFTKNILVDGLTRSQAAAIADKLNQLEERIVELEGLLGLIGTGVESCRQPEGAIVMRCGHYAPTIVEGHAPQNTPDGSGAKARVKSSTDKGESVSADTENRTWKDAKK